MRLRVRLGLNITKEVNWWNTIENFPHLISFKAVNFEWFMYEADPAKMVDFILTFAEVPMYSSKYKHECPSWELMFSPSGADCQCGAMYTCFPFDHMRFCPKWEKW